MYKINKQINKTNNIYIYIFILYVYYVDCHREWSSENNQKKADKDI